MILVDISQIVIANAFAAKFKAARENVVVDEHFVRTMVLNSLRLYNKQFKREYGEMVVCFDSKDTWRKKEFPNYKANRKKDDGVLDWPMIFKTLDQIYLDLKTYFPYKVIKIAGCEADDIMGGLARRQKLSPTDKNVLIISGDKDMKQLVSDTVKIFHPIDKEFVSVPNPALFLKELCIRGDKDDGVPNMLADDDCLVTPGKRQPSIFDKKVEVWVHKDATEFCENATILKNYWRNCKLIDLSNTPVCLQSKILEEYSIPANGNQSTITTYFMNNRMRNLMDVINEF